MKKLLLVFLCYCCMHLAAQDKRANNDSVCRLVQRYFNAKNADSLYALTGTGWQPTHPVLMEDLEMGHYFES